MKVRGLQVDCCKPIPGLNAFDNTNLCQHLDRELVKGMIQDSQIQDRSKNTALLRYDEVRAVKPIPHLGWRDWLDCILRQQDSYLLAQDRGISDCNRSLKNVVELWMLPGKLNHVAESNCPNEPAGQVAQRKPRSQTPYKWHQRDRRCTCSGAAKGSSAGWPIRHHGLSHRSKTPRAPGGSGQRHVERRCISEPQSLGH